jgi:hypothetical protein
MPKSFIFYFTYIIYELDGRLRKHFGKSLRLNAVYMSRSHKKKYFRFKQNVKLLSCTDHRLICFGFGVIGRVTSLYQVNSNISAASPVL